MSIVYLNGQYLPESQATVSVNDRGFILADGIYEVTRLYDGKFFTLDRHLQRMRDGLGAIRLRCDIDHLANVTLELLKRNNLRDAKTYWQITRGPAPRNHAFPKEVNPTVFASVSYEPPIDEMTSIPEVGVILYPDRRWAECWIKSLMLLPNALARQAAAEQDCVEAILHRGDIVTEGAAMSVFAVIDGELRTHPLDGSILPSVTRSVLLEVARDIGVPVREEAFTVDELRDAEELFVASTSKHIHAVTRCDQKVWAVGAITRQLHEGFIDRVRRELKLVTPTAQSPRT